MKHLLIIATVLAATTAFANDPATHGSHGTTTQSDPTTPQTPADKNAKPMKKHKGTAGKAHPSMNKTGNSEQAPAEGTKQ